MNWNGLLSQVTSQTASLSGNLGKQFTQAAQLAKEKMGGAGVDITELPAEYRELEEKVDKIKLLHENFLKVSRTLTLPHNDYNPPVGDSMMDYATSFQNLAVSGAAATQRAVGMPPSVDATPLQSEIPKSLSSAFSKVAYYSSFYYSPDDPMSVALKKFSGGEEKLGNAKVKFDSDVSTKFHEPFLNTLNTLIADSTKSRSQANSARLIYDSSRSKLKSAKLENSRDAKTHMEACEDEFVSAVDVAMGNMKKVVENTDALKYLADLVAAQLAYFKTCYETLSELSPELDELQVTNEALHRKR